MLLAIDCGNTNTIFSIWDGNEFISTWRTATDHQRTADQYFVWLSSLMSLQNIKADISDVIISSTVPRVVFNLRVLSDRYFNTRPIVVGKPDCKVPIDVRVDAGTAVGPDRIVNSVAGYDLFGGNLIIVDFGTATTFDVVDKDGAYVGGVIAPGVNLSLQACIKWQRHYLMLILRDRKRLLEPIQLRVCSLGFFGAILVWLRKFVER